MSDNAEQSVEVRWPIDATQNPQTVNQFVFMEGPPLMGDQPDDLMYMVAGNFVPPVSFQPDDLRRAIEATGGHLTVQPVASLCMTVGRAREMYMALGEHLAKRDARQATPHQ